MGLIFNENKREFAEMLEYVDELASFLYEAQGVRLINPLSLKKLQYLAEADQVDEYAYLVIAPKVKQIAEFASANLYYLNPQTNKRVYNLSNFKSSLQPAIDQLKASLATLVPNNCVVPRESVKRLQDPLNPATGYNKKHRQAKSAQGQRTVAHFKPTDVFVTPSQDTVDQLEELLKLYSEKLIRTGVFDKNNSKNPSRKRETRIPLATEIQRYKEAKYLTSKKEAEIVKATKSLILKTDGFNDVRETMVESIGELEAYKKALAVLKAKLARVGNLSPEAEQYIAANGIAPVVAQNPVKKHK